MVEHVIGLAAARRSSRYYMDPSVKNGPVIIKKAADPELIKKAGWLNKGQYRYKRDLRFNTSKRYKDKDVISFMKNCLEL